MSAHAHAAPVGGPILTRGLKRVIAFFALAAAVMVWRLAVGLGATTALNDGYPWGLWIAFDVVVGTALGCGGYAVALLVYVLNRGRYHPVVRPAILTSALGYSLAAVAIVLDVGRPWLMWKIPLFFWDWNLNSALLEVALCVMSYVAVLWLELSPALMERWKVGPPGMLRSVSTAVYPAVNGAMPAIIALGLLLPTMHQSSLGTVMLLAGPKLHPLWSTPLLPLLFLVSCVGMGYAVVVFESTLAAIFFKREPETKMLVGLGRAMVPILFLYVALRLVDLAARGRLGLVLAFDGYSLLFFLEIALFLAPAIMLLGSRAPSLGRLFRASMLMVGAGALYRFSTYVIAYSPGRGWSYFPAVPELIVTLGIVAFEVIAYVVLVKTFPILSAPPAHVPPADYAVAHAAAER